MNYYWINIKAFKSILNQTDIESNCNLKNRNWIESWDSYEYPALMPIMLLYNLEWKT